MISLEELKRIRTSGLPAAARHIFLELSFRANKDGFCWPSVKRIACDTGYSENHVRRVTRLLADANWIRIEQREGRSCLYEIRPLENGQGESVSLTSSPTVTPPPAPTVTPPPAPTVTPPAPTVTPPAPASDVKLHEAFHESADPIHDDLKDHVVLENHNVDLIQQTWRSRNPPSLWPELDERLVLWLLRQATEQEIIAAIESYQHGNDLNPTLLENRIDFIRMTKKTRKG